MIVSKLVNVPEENKVVSTSTKKQSLFAIDDILRTDLESQHNNEDDGEAVKNTRETSLLDESSDCENALVMDLSGDHN